MTFMRSIIFIILSLWAVACTNSNVSYDGGTSSTKSGGDDLRNGSNLNNNIGGSNNGDGMSLSGSFLCEKETFNPSTGKWGSSGTVNPSGICDAKAKTLSKYAFCHRGSLGDLECLPYNESLDLKLFGISDAYKISAANHTQCRDIAKKHSTASNPLDCLEINKVKSL